MSVWASIKYKYQVSGSQWNTTYASGNVVGKSESAVMAYLEKKHPGKEIVILNVEYKD